MLKGQAGGMCFSRVLEGEDLAEAIKKRVEQSDIKAGIFFLEARLNPFLGIFRERFHNSF
jgi:predicted DNA-binding protein with PD1-like motif